ncbi:hypothetical protein [Nitrincola sp. A-D6]|uniref:hypothetical protein n=1 Tax=Nitrincola sp. A-D6 TaxID=1545442 RepID=UPI001F2CDFC5|nr:hypothetical protein [Nitrincola sp. A-D6]
MIDEAHNLIDRARGMYSSQLSQSQFRQVARTAPKELSTTFRAVQRAWNQLIKCHLDSMPALIYKLCGFICLRCRLS